MVRYFSPLYMDGRASSDIDAFPSCNNARHRLLFALPLEHHDCGDRRLGAARAAADCARACPRNRRYDRRLRTWAERALSDPRGVLRGGVAFDRMISLVPVVFFIGQSLGDYVLAPCLVSRRVHLN